MAAVAIVLLAAVCACVAVAAWIVFLIKFVLYEPMDLSQLAYHFQSFRCTHINVSNVERLFTTTKGILFAVSLVQMAVNTTSIYMHFASETDDFYANAVGKAEMFFMHYDFLNWFRGVKGREGSILAATKAYGCLRAFSMMRYLKYLTPAGLLAGFQQQYLYNTAIRNNRKVVAAAKASIQTMMWALLGCVGAMALRGKMLQVRFVIDTDPQLWTMMQYVYFVAFLNNVVSIVDADDHEMRRIILAFFGRADAELQKDEVELSLKFETQILKSIWKSELRLFQKLAITLKFDASDYQKLIIQEQLPDEYAQL